MDASNNTPNQEDSFLKLQYAFTQHMRDPENVSVPKDIEDRRMQIYRDLLYKNVESFMAGSFPVLRKLHDDETWYLMIRDYFKNHISHTPLFPKMPQEFLHYLQNEREAKENDFPFLFELAHYEWVELAIDLDNREIELQGVDSTGDLLEGIPVINPVSMSLAYEWPVQQISPENIPEEKPTQATYIIVYRNIELKTLFLELNPVSAKLIEKIQSNNQQTGKELLIDIAFELQHPDQNLVINSGLQIMQDMLQRQVLLGTKKIN